MYNVISLHADKEKTNVLSIDVECLELSVVCFEIAFT